MSQPRLISDYLAILAAQLPAPLVEELADGLAETHRFYLRQGLVPEAAVRAAVAEFGDPQVIVAEFARMNPARRAARKLLTTGPMIGACWAAALVTSQAWAWQVPLLARLLLGLLLCTVIALIAVASLGTRYRLAARTGLAGCIGVIMFDILMITGVLLTAPTLTWVTIGAMAASTARIAFSTTTLRPAG